MMRDLEQEAIDGAKRRIKINEIRIANATLANRPDWKESARRAIAAARLEIAEAESAMADRTDYTKEDGE